MHLCIWVGAAIADDNQTMIQIAGVANGGQYDAAGVDTGEHQRVGLMRCLTTIGSLSRAAAVGWIATPSVPATAIPLPSAR
jgi:hypothetical protein